MKAPSKGRLVDDMGASNSAGRLAPALKALTESDL